MEKAQQSNTNNNKQSGPRNNNNNRGENVTKKQGRNKMEKSKPRYSKGRPPIPAINSLDKSPPKRARCADKDKDANETQVNVEIDISKLALDIWEKKRCLKAKSEHFSIPREFFKEPTWKVEEFQNQKDRLNQTKSHLDGCDLDPWHKHTRRMNTAGEVIPAVRTQFRPEFGSQAWCKFYECLSTYPVIPEMITSNQQGYPLTFVSVHLCEAPGAFISATNHFLQTNHPHIEWEWLGTTLNPHYEGNDVGSMINEDKLILTSLKNWTFLQDNTGNIMSESNINCLIQKVQQKFQTDRGQRIPVHLVTADGSIDCQSNPMEQEAMVSHLHFVEIVAALHILGDAGTFVLKMFTFLECQAMSHLYLLCSLFSEVHLFKPATSKEGNSEVYVICLGYLGKSRFLKELSELKKFVGANDVLSQQNSLLSKITVFKEPFFDRIRSAAKFFTGYQMGIIKRNLECYSSTDSGIYFFYDIIRTEVAQEWLNRFKVARLQTEQRLFGHINTRKKPHVDGREEMGTFLDKLKRNTAGVWLKMKYIKEELRFFKTYGHSEAIRSVVKMDNLDKVQLSQVKGKPYENILSSRFCFGKLLLQRQELRDVVKRFESVLKRNGTKKHLTGDCSEDFLIKEFSAIFPDIKNKKNDWMLHRLCFHETFDDLYFSKDINTTRKGLKNVLKELALMKIGHSLFLCEFPLLTRLHVGLMYALSSIFEKVMVYLNIEKTIRGLMLHNYYGMKSKSEGTWVEQMAHILVNLHEDKDSVVLQIIPTEVLANLPCYDDIFTYNLYNTAANLEEIIDETKETLWKCRKPNPSEGHLGLKVLAQTPDELDTLRWI